MNKDSVKLIIIILKIVKIYSVTTTEIPIYNIQGPAGHNHITSYPLLNLELSSKPLCLVNNKFIDCDSILDDEDSGNKRSFNPVNEKTFHVHNLNRLNSVITEVQPILQRLLMSRPTSAMNMNSRMMYPLPGPGYTPNFASAPKFNMLLNNVNNAYGLPPRHTQPANGFTPIFGTRFPHNLILKPNVAISVTEPTLPYQILSSYEKFSRSLDYFERKFYMVTFNKLTSISPPERRVNGMSFVQSGFFLLLTLMALSLEVDSLTKAEIDRAIGFRTSEKEITNIIKDVVSSLLDDSDKIKFRRASRLMLWPGREVTPRFRVGPASALRLGIDMFNGTERPEQLHTVLNQKIETDSGGAIRDTFDEDDLSGGVTAVLTTTLYFRARWRAAPTVLNGTYVFRDSEDAPKRTVRMIKLNDIMGYADLREWNAEALEIPYASPELSLVIIIPRVPSLRRLTECVTSNSIRNITSRMRRLRVAATLPLYTLRMTLLLPNKLQAMGVSRLFNVSNLKPSEPLRLSHMVQRLMFWAEAGRNAYKDDGLEWDETPEMQILVDRPYIFFVRWRNLTLMNDVEKTFDSMEVLLKLALLSGLRLTDVSVHHREVAENFQISKNATMTERIAGLIRQMSPMYKSLMNPAKPKKC